MPAATADYYNDYDKKTIIYKHIYRNAASLLVGGLAACPDIIKFTKPSTIVTRCLIPPLKPQPTKNWQFQNIFGILINLFSPQPVLSKVEGFMRGSVIPAKAGIHFKHLVILKFEFVSYFEFRISYLTCLCVSCIDNRA